MHLLIPLLDTGKRQYKVNCETQEDTSSGNTGTILHSCTLICLCLWPWLSALLSSVIQECPPPTNITTFSFFLPLVQTEKAFHGKGLGFRRLLILKALLVLSRRSSDSLQAWDTCGDKSHMVLRLWITHCSQHSAIFQIHHSNFYCEMLSLTIENLDALYLLTPLGCFSRHH